MMKGFLLLIPVFLLLFSSGCVSGQRPVMVLDPDINQTLVYNTYNMTGGKNGTAPWLNWSVTAIDFNYSYAAGVFQEEVGADCGAGNYSYGVSDDGVLLCRPDMTSEAGESDPVWSANYTACSSSQKLYFNGRNLACNNDVDTDTDTYNTTKQMQDACGALLGGTETGISVAYDDANNDIDFVVSVADAQVVDDITLASTKNVTTTQYIVLAVNQKICFANCSIYIMFNSTTGNLTISNQGG
jgi:hypothetical protein